MVTYNHARHRACKKKEDLKMIKRDFLERYFLDKKYELQGSKDGYTQSIDRDQVADTDTGELYYDDYALIDEDGNKTIITQDDMATFVATW